MAHPGSVQARQNVQDCAYVTHSKNQVKVAEKYEKCKKVEIHSAEKGKSK